MMGRGGGERNYQSKIGKKEAENWPEKQAKTGNILNKT